jgi:FtsZ-interacting cell division protein ZipA
VRAARQLADRLDGKMADQHGEELTSQRIARLRQAIEPPPPARASGSD